jgi:N-methylhydantoinase A
VAVARKVGIPEVIVPTGAGVTSALGLLTAPMAVDLVQSSPSPLSEVNWDGVARVLADLERRGRAVIAVEEGAVAVEQAVDMRYVGQAHEISVRLPLPATDPGIEDALRASFDETYRRLYSVLNDSFGIEILNWRVRVAGPSADLWFGSGAADDVEQTSRPVWEPSSQSFVEAPVYRQTAMAVGRSFEGPLVVEQRETTAIVGATDSAHIDASGNLVIQVGP